jgi:hypothetical protein
MTKVAERVAARVGQGEEVVSEIEYDMEEGNEFSGALAKAKASNQDEFEVDGKSYPVEEETDSVEEKETKEVEEGREVNPINDSLALMKKLAGIG